MPRFSEVAVFTLLLSAALAGTPPTPTQLDPHSASVLEWYRACPDPWLASYPLSRKGDRWVAPSLADPDEGEILSSVTVDLKNGYIEVWDDGTGGCSVRLKVVLWRRADGTGLLGLSRDESDGLWFKNGHRFYRVEDGAFRDVTSEVTPGWTPALFFEPGWYEQHGAALEAALAPEWGELVTWDLPRHGTSIEFAEGYSYALAIELESGDLPPERAELLRSARAALREDDGHPVKLVLEWDRASGTFHLAGEGTRP